MKKYKIQLRSQKNSQSCVPQRDGFFDFFMQMGSLKFFQQMFKPVRFRLRIRKDRHGKSTPLEGVNFIHLS
jgi:hypothetical protein